MKMYINASREVSAMVYRKYVSLSSRHGVIRKIRGGRFTQILKYLPNSHSTEYYVNSLEKFRSRDESTVSDGLK